MRSYILHGSICTYLYCYYLHARAAKTFCFTPRTIHGPCRVGLGPAALKALVNEDLQMQT